MRNPPEILAENVARVEHAIVTEVTASIVCCMARTVTDYIAALVYAILMAGTVLGGFYGAHVLMGYGTLGGNMASGLILCSMPVVIGWLLSQMSRLANSR